MTCCRGQFSDDPAWSRLCTYQKGIEPRARELLGHDSQGGRQEIRHPRVLRARTWPYSVIPMKSFSPGPSSN